MSDSPIPPENFEAGETVPLGLVQKIQSIEDAITGAIEKIEKIEPDIRVGPPGRLIFDSNQIKSDLTHSLDDVRTETRGVMGVFTKLQTVKAEVQQEIIAPMQSLIKKADKRATRYGIFNLSAGFIGVFVALSGITIWHGLGDWRGLKQNSTANDGVNNGSKPADQTASPSDPTASPGFDTLSALLEHKEPVYEILRKVQDFENSVRNTSEFDDADKCEQTPNRWMADRKSGAHDPETEAAITYATMVCESASKNKDWGRVTAFADAWGVGKPKEKKGLNETAYGFAIRVYSIEALVQKKGPLDQALKEYGTLANGIAAGGAQEFLSPLNSHQRISGDAFVRMRLSELTAQMSLVNDRILIYDMSDGTIANQLASALKNNSHLEHANAQSDWDGKNFTQAYIYYRVRTDRAQAAQILSGLVSEALPKTNPPKPQNYENCQMDAVKRRFDQQADLDFLILLPSTAH